MEYVVKSSRTNPYCVGDWLESSTMTTVTPSVLFKHYKESSDTGMERSLPGLSRSDHDDYLAAHIFTHINHWPKKIYNKRV